MKSFQEYINEMGMSWEFNRKKQIGVGKNLAAVFDPKNKELYLKDLENKGEASLVISLTPEQVAKFGHWTNLLHSKNNFASAQI